MHICSSAIPMMRVIGRASVSLAYAPFLLSTDHGAIHVIPFSAITDVNELVPQVTLITLWVYDSETCVDLGLVLTKAR
jgi:hypothetical protein